MWLDVMIIKHFQPIQFCVELGRSNPYNTFNFYKIVNTQVKTQIVFNLQKGGLSKKIRNFLEGERKNRGWSSDIVLWQPTARKEVTTT